MTPSSPHHYARSSRPEQRVPQIMRPFDLATFADARRRACPLRPGSSLYGNEGPWATAWLAYRGDTVRLRRITDSSNPLPGFSVATPDFGAIAARLLEHYFGAQS